MAAASPGPRGGPPRSAGRRGWRSLAVAAATAGVTAALLPIVLVRSNGHGGAGPPDTSAPAAGRLLDADADGAVVADGHGVIRGLRSSGEVVWTDAKAAAEGSSVTCAGRCPSAVVSAGVASRVPPHEPDPAPRVLGGPPLAIAAHPRVRVLAADDAAMVLVVADEDGRAWLETWAGAARTARLPVPSAATAWNPASDRSAATAVTDTTDPHHFEVRALRREPGGWAVAGEPVRSSIPLACTGGRGGVIVADPRPRLVTGDGRGIVIPGLRSAGECSFGAAGAVVAHLSVTARGPAARVVLIDDAGAVRWRGDVEGATRVHADHTGDRFVIVADGRAEERSGDGSVLRTVAGVDDARYDERGALVVLHVDGRVRWLAWP